MDAHTIDKVALGKAVLEYTRLSLDKAFASIEKHGSAMKILHIRFADNIKNPQGICKQVMETVSVISLLCDTYDSLFGCAVC